MGSSNRSFEHYEHLPRGQSYKTFQIQIHSRTLLRISTLHHVCREVKSVVKMEGNKLVTVQTAKKDGEKSTKSVREFNGDELVYTMEIVGGDITCVQKFKRM